MNSKQMMTRQEIMAIPSPEFTKTWSPVPHKDIIESLDLVLRTKGIGVVKEHYSVKNNGKNVFGSLVLDNKIGEKHVQIGWRNSIDKSFAVGVCSGVYVVVCSNMMFKGEFVEFRKHTNGMTFDRLLEMETAAIGTVIEQSIADINWQDNLRRFWLEKPVLAEITYDAMKSGILPPSHFNEYIEAHDAEIELSDGGSSLYEFHGAITRLNRDLNLFTVNNRTKNLCRLCDDYAIRLAA